MKIIRLFCLLAAFLALHGAAKERVVGYVTSWGKYVPAADAVTTINYAFGHVNSSFDGVDIDNPDRLKVIAALKRENKDLEVVLSIGGWGSGNFSEMAADPQKRKAFAADCKRIVKEYELDGIDIDWEYPGSSRGGISSSPYDKDNFLLLMRDLRKKLGRKSLLTMASPATVGFYEFKPLMKYVDWVNVMGYDLNRPPYHQSSLFRSALSGDMTVDEGIRAHISGGVPPEKIVLGIPFYGHGRKGRYPDVVNFNRISPGEGEQVMFDEVACVPYIADDEGRMLITYDDERSVARKCRYVKENGLGGVMFWEFGGDTPSAALLHAIDASLNTDIGLKK